MKKLTILFVLLTALFVVTASALCKCECLPDVPDLRAKYEWRDEWVFEKGDDVVDLMGDNVSVEWTTDETLCPVAKGGQECAIYPCGTSGTITSADTGGFGLSNIKFCGDEPTAVVLRRFAVRPHRAARSLEWWEWIIRWLGF